MALGLADQLSPPPPPSPLQINKTVSQQPVQHPVLYMQNKYQFSKALEGLAGNVLTLYTSAQNSYISAPSLGIDLSQYICPVKPITCTACQTKYQNNISSITGVTYTTYTAFFNAWLTLYNAGQYPTALFYQTPSVQLVDGTVQPGSWVFQCPEPCDSYTCAECPNVPGGRQCAIYVQAGSDIAVVVKAVNIFNKAQTAIRDDIFSVAVHNVTEGWLPGDLALNPNNLTAAPIVLGPVFRSYYSDRNNGTLGGMRGSTTPAPGTPLEDPIALDWDYPNYHDLSTWPRPGGYTEKAGESFDYTGCGPNNDFPSGEETVILGWKVAGEGMLTATHAPPAGRCARYIVRPRVFGSTGGTYITNFAIDKVGQYYFKVTYMGNDPTIQVFASPDGFVDLGPSLTGSPFNITVLPGHSDSRLTIALGPGIVTTEVGAVSSFNISVYDKFGNKVTQGGDRVSVLLKGIDYVTGTLPATAGLPGPTTDPLNQTPWATISDYGNGDYLVEYMMVHRSKTDPVPSFNAFIYLNGLQIRGPDLTTTTPYTVNLTQGATNGTHSFAFENGFLQSGLGVRRAVVAGQASLFTLQARDRFNNTQGTSNDTFFIEINDGTGCAYAFTKTLFNSELPNAVAPNTMLTGVATCAASSTPSMDPVVSITPQPDPSGQYLINYTVYRAGGIKFGLALNYDNGLFNSVGGSDDGVYKGFTQTVTVIAANTVPAYCTATGPAIQENGFTAGDVGSTGRGVAFNIQLRDIYNNSRSSIESILKTSSNLPQVVAYYKYKCTTNMQTKSYINCTGINQRNMTSATLGAEGTLIQELPIRDSGDTVFNPSTGIAALTTTMSDIGNGTFGATIFTTLAGRYDMSILVKPVDATGKIAPPYSAQPITGPRYKIGTASADPSNYLDPFSVVVQPAAFSPAMSEVFSFWPIEANATTGRTSSDILYSSVQGLLYNLQATSASGSSSLTVATMTYIYGRVGQSSWFYIQMRDMYGNMYLTSASTPPVVTLAGSDQTGAAFILSSNATVGSANWVNVTDLGSGLYQVTYNTSNAGNFAVRIAFTSGEVRPLVSNNGVISSSSSLFTLIVRPSTPVALYSAAYGPGLRGTVKNSMAYIYVQLRDQYNNPWQDFSTGYTDTTLYLSRLRLYLTKVGNSSSYDPYPNCGYNTVYGPGPFDDGINVRIVAPGVKLVKNVPQYGQFQLAYMPYGQPGACQDPALFYFFRVDVEFYDGSTWATIGGNTDVLDASGNPLKLLPYTSASTVGVYAAVRLDGQTADPGNTSLAQIDGVAVTDFTSARVGNAMSLVIQARDSLGIDATGSDQLGYIEGGFVEKSITPCCAVGVLTDN